MSEKNFVAYHKNWSKNYFFAQLIVGGLLSEKKILKQSYAIIFASCAANKLLLLQLEFYTIFFLMSEKM
jgi:hypothetical protein